ncbi:MAG TPA: malonyl-ACP O-methyltransferase BioC [Burkholderiales bacterium]|nr:malonyl-ACP O-methyltransferase BioC [Burkholderiales bacterium]
MDDQNPYALDRPQLRASFERAAATYDGAAGLQREIADRLLERLDDVRFAPTVALDIGCGTGYCTRALRRRYSDVRVVGLDLAHAMLRRANRRDWWRFFNRRPDFVCGDTESLPVATASVDLIVSNLTLQWCNPIATFAEFRRVLRPGSLLMFTSFGPETLREVRLAWSAIDDRPHVHGFLDLRDVGDLLFASGFTDPVVDVDRMTRHYPTVMDVLRELKQIGAHNVALGRARGLTGKQRFAHFRDTYEGMRSSQGIPVTYEIVFGHAWAPTADQAARRDDGIAAVPVSAIRRRRV